jgi:hypothetical protein
MAGTIPRPVFRVAVLRRSWSRLLFFILKNFLLEHDNGLHGILRGVLFMWTSVHLSGPPVL